jgi:hypothetical protein
MGGYLLETRIDQGLDELKRPLLWNLLDRYQDVFAWNKGNWDAAQSGSTPLTHKDSRLVERLQDDCHIGKRRK